MQEATSIYIGKEIPRFRHPCILVSNLMTNGDTHTICWMAFLSGSAGEQLAWSWSNLAVTLNGDEKFDLGQLSKLAYGDAEAALFEHIEVKLGQSYAGYLMSQRYSLDAATVGDLVRIRKWGLLTDGIVRNMSEVKMASDLSNIAKALAETAPLIVRNLGK